MIIDAHGHLVPDDLIAAIRNEHKRFPSLRLVESASASGGSLALAFAGGKPSRPIMKGLSDVALPPAVTRSFSDEKNQTRANTNRTIVSETVTRVRNLVVHSSASVPTAFPAVSS